MGASDEEIRRHVLDRLASLHITTEAPAVLGEQQKALPGCRRPLQSPPTRLSGPGPIREMLRVTSADEQPSAMLRAREILENLATLF